MAELFAALGFTPEPIPIPREAYAQFGLDGDQGVPRALHRVARHRDLIVLLLEVQNPTDRDLIRRLATRLYHHNRAARRLLVFADPAYERLVLATWGLGGDPLTLRSACLKRQEPRRGDLDLLRDLSPGTAHSSTELAWRHAQALDRERLTRRFYLAIRRARDALAAAWTGVPEPARADRSELALLTISRLLFLVFLQQKGWLDGDPHYLRHLCERAKGEGRRLYREVLSLLFFEALNRRPHRRSEPARRLGVLPFLNGGLFEPYPVERRHPGLQAPDEVFSRIVLDLFERHRFTVQEDTPLDHDAAVDPEMLGRVFEGLMHAGARAATGAFYTPSSLVATVVNEAMAAYVEKRAGLTRDAARSLVHDRNAQGLDAQARALALEAIRNVRILDPAAGSGAFLLAALQTTEALLRALDSDLARVEAWTLRQTIIHENLYGVDMNAAAVRLCELRLWLALVVDLDARSVADVPPLPNIDHKVRQGDTLLDPMDALAALTEGAGGPGRSLDVLAQWAREAEELRSLKDGYLSASGSRKEDLARALRSRELALARPLLDRLTERADGRIRELRDLGRARDLFGERLSLTLEQRAALRDALQARRDLRALVRRMSEARELPFFAFAIHFADVQGTGGFDIVLGNPPWVRPHHLRPHLRRALRARYGSARNGAWAAGADLAGAGPGFASQVDLAALFVERGLELLRPGGILAFLIPAKLAHALYGGGLRARLLEHTSLLLLDDHSRDDARLFQAVTYPLVMVCRKEPPASGHRTELTLRTRRRIAVPSTTRQKTLPIWPADPASPWCLVPEDVRRVIARMVEAGPPLARAGFTPARGIFTGANHIYCLASVQALGNGTCRVTAEGYRVAAPRGRAGFRANVEPDVVLPLLRGEDIRAWRQRPSGWILFTHDHKTGGPLTRLPPGVARYLRQHEGALRRRKDLRPADPVWTVFRVTCPKLGPCVAWRDLGERLEAVTLPGLPTGPVPLNTVYLIPTPAPDTAHALAALFNSRLVSAFLRTFAERAASGFLRFFAWTVGCLPLPGGWFPLEKRLQRLAEIGERGHAQSGLTPREAEELEALVTELYGLSSEDIALFLPFDAGTNAPRSAHGE